MAEAGFPYPRGNDGAALALWARQLVDRLNGVRRADTETIDGISTTVDTLQTTTTTQQGQIDTLNTAVETLESNALTPQQLFELELTTASNAVFGSAQALSDDALRWAQAQAEAALDQAVQSYQNRAGIFTEQTVRLTATEALASQITTLTADLATTSASVTTEAAARATGDDANAASITTVSAQVTGNTTSIATILSADGTTSNWAVTTNANGQVTGMARLNGSATGTEFVVVADKFVVAKPGAPGTTQVVFVAGTINGVSGVGINGDVLIDGSVLARHIAVSSLSALTADLGTVTAGLIRNSAGTVLFDLDNMRIYRPDGKLDFNMATPSLYFQS